MALTESIKIKYDILMIFFLVNVFLLIGAHGACAGERARVALFPFVDSDSESLDREIPLTLQEQLRTHHFLEIVPLETRYHEIYEVEPLYMWSEAGNRGDKGGMIWQIRPALIEEYTLTKSVEYTIYGDFKKYEDIIRLNLTVSRSGIAEYEKTFDIRNSGRNKIRVFVDPVATEIAIFIKSRWIVNEAEEEIRKYKGGLRTLATGIDTLRTYINEFPTSLFLRALLLDLYLNDKERYSEDILSDCLKLIDLYDSARHEDTRYLLSLNMDPFHIVAEEYEKRKELLKAIEQRRNALKVFRFKEEIHKVMIGTDYYDLARISEKTGRKEEALMYYRNALEYLPASSALYGDIKKRVENN